MNYLFFSMLYKILIKQISSGYVRSRIARLGQRQLFELRERINVIQGDFMVLDIVELEQEK